MLDADADLTSTITKTVIKKTQARIIQRVWFNEEDQPEKHFHELLMLYTSRRNEQTDLLRALYDLT